jgi:endonuclease YncB( thermonuclease family)
MFSLYAQRGAPRRGKNARGIPRRLYRKLIMLIVGLAVTAAGFHVTKGRVIQVADGDTVVVHTGMGRTDRIRLYGIDAPESKQRGGDEANGFARDMLLFSPVSLSVIDTDQYGRSVALIRLEDGRIANEEMVRAGHAWVYRGYCREAFCAKWLALEHQARKQGLGLWRRSDPTPPWQWRRAGQRR